MENFEIYIERAVIGTKLSLGNKALNKNYQRWAVEEMFNGPSLPAEIYRNEVNGKIAECIYGFYNSGDIVTLKLYGKNGILEKTVNNVVIIDKEEVNQ